MALSRRSFFKGLLAAPLVVSAGSIMPVRSIERFLFPPRPAWCPEGWLPCDGREVSPTQYRDLYAAIGNAFGGRVPDLSARSVPSFGGDDARLSVIKDGFIETTHLIRAEPSPHAPVGSVIMWMKMPLVA